MSAVKSKKLSSRIELPTAQTPTLFCITAHYTAEDIYSTVSRHKPDLTTNITSAGVRLIAPYLDSIVNSKIFGGSEPYIYIVIFHIQPLRRDNITTAE